MVFALQNELETRLSTNTKLLDTTRPFLRLIDALSDFFELHHVSTHSIIMSVKYQHQRIIMVSESGCHVDLVDDVVVVRQRRVFPLRHTSDEKPPL